MHSTIQVWCTSHALVPSKTDAPAMHSTILVDSTILVNYYYYYYTVGFTCKASPVEATLMHGWIAPIMVWCTTLKLHSLVWCTAQSSLVHCQPWIAPPSLMIPAIGLHHRNEFFGEPRFSPFVFVIFLYLWSKSEATSKWCWVSIYIHFTETIQRHSRMGWASGSIRCWINNRLTSSECLEKSFEAHPSEAMKYGP